MRPTPRLAPLLFVSLGACAPAPYDLPLSWVFVDGRDCADAGVEVVALRMGDAQDGPVARCTGGQGGRAVALPQVTGRQIIRAAALSPAGGALYRGADRAPDDPGPLELVLYFTGGG